MFLYVVYPTAQIRWKESVEKLELRLKGIIGDTLVSAAFIVYCGVFTSEYRAQLMGQWLEFCKTYQIPVSEDYSFVHAMAAESEVLCYNISLVGMAIEVVELAVTARPWYLRVPKDSSAI